MKNEIWILGATGRSGRHVASLLANRGVALVLVGRSRETLDALATSLPGEHRILVGSLEQNLAQLSSDAPGVVVNTVGPFATTATQVAGALPAGTHYADLSNEFAATDDILKLDRQAADAGQTLVSGAGYGVLGTESVVLRLCEGRPKPASVRVDALPAIVLEGGTVGAALAGSIVQVVRFGGREVREGRLVRSATGAHFARLVTPDGDVLSTGGGASGELLAAWRASGAPSVVAASTAAPRNPLVRRLAIPVLSAIIRIPGVPRFLERRIAGIPLTAAPMPRASTWAHALVRWDSGEVREGWLRLGNASDFTSGVLAEVAYRLLQGDGRPGAFTPGSLFGAELAEQLGGVLTTSSSW